MSKKDNAPTHESTKNNLWIDGMCYQKGEPLVDVSEGRIKTLGDAVCPVKKSKSAVKEVASAPEDKSMADRPIKETK